MCHVSRVTCHLSRVIFFSLSLKKLEKVVELFGGGFIINGATPSSLQILNMIELASKQPQNSISLVQPQSGMLLSGHAGGVNSYKQLFWTGPDSSYLGQPADPYTKTILDTERF